MKYAWLLSVPKPIIAAIHGPAVGLGFVIPLYCDLRFASESGEVFGDLFEARTGRRVRSGVDASRGSSVPAAAIDLMFSSRMVDAQEALRLGLVQRVFPARNSRAKFTSSRRSWHLPVSPRSLRVMKKQIYASLSQTLPQAFEMAIDEMKSSLTADDFKRGHRAFLKSVRRRLRADKPAYLCIP
jgi:enoyl-CoA hydratase/carnithine racemase